MHVSSQNTSQQLNIQLPKVKRALPGPAGKLQELAAAGALHQATPEALGLRESSCASLSVSQAYIQRDAAFLSSTWAAATARAADDEVVAGPISSIKAAKDLGVGKLPRMLVMLGSFHPSGSDSAFSKVKDPTGTMGAAIHSSTLQQQQQLGLGCVLLLQQVSVLTPSPGSSYLAITAANVVQVWAAEQPGHSIRNAAHQPAATPQQQQQPLNPGANRLGQKHAHVAATAAASHAGSRGSNSMFPPPSPDIMSVLQQPSSRQGGAVGVHILQQPETGHVLPQQQQQQQQQQHRPFHPSTSQQPSSWHMAEPPDGCSPTCRPTQYAAVDAAQHHSATPQHRASNSMPPPPPRRPAASMPQQHGSLEHQPRQQQQQHHQGGVRKGPQLDEGCVSLQQPLPSAGTLTSSPGCNLTEGSLDDCLRGTSAQACRLDDSSTAIKPPAATPGAGTVQGGTADMLAAGNAFDQGVLSVARGASSAAAHAETRRIQQSSKSQGMAALWSTRRGAATPAALVLGEDEDVDMDENIVAAIFGSQVSKPVAPAPTVQQPWQPGAVGTTGAGVQQMASAPGTHLHAPPGVDRWQPAQPAKVPQFETMSQAQPGTTRPPLVSTQCHQQQQPGTQQRQQGKASTDWLARAVPVPQSSLLSTALGKRSAGPMSLLDDLVADDMDGW